MSSGFPSLKPALILNLSVTDAHHVGTVASGSTFTHYVAPTGTLKSVPGFTPVIDSKVVFGADWLYIDPDGSRARVNVKGIVKTDDDASISFEYTGIMDINEEMKLVFARSPEARSMPFGQYTSHHTFQVGDVKYKELENRVWVGNGRFILGGAEALGVEIKISSLVASTDME